MRISGGVMRATICECAYGAVEAALLPHAVRPGFRKAHLRQLTECGGLALGALQKAGVEFAVFERTGGPASRWIRPFLRRSLD